MTTSTPNPVGHRQGVMDVISVINGDSSFTVLQGFGIKFTTKGAQDYHEYDIGVLDLRSDHFLLVGKICKMLMDKPEMTFNEMYDQFELFRKYIDKHVKMIIEIDDDGPGEQSHEKRIRQAYTQGVAVARWRANNLKFVRINLADTTDPRYIRKKLWLKPSS